MATATANRAATEIKVYIDSHRLPYREWYVGIASNGRDRVFNQHGVKERTDKWIICQPLPTSTEAREVEAYFVDDLKTDGGKSGGDETTRTVYAYHKEAHTTE